MMTCRERVSRSGRLPQTIIVDGRPDFRSTYFETSYLFLLPSGLHRARQKGLVYL
jgi:hypothetical protein